MSGDGIGNIAHGPERIAVPMPMDKRGGVAYPVTERDPSMGSEVEYVRADLHAGAVKERDLLRDYIQRVLTEDLHSQADKRAWSRLREALYLTGGQ